MILGPTLADGTLPGVSPGIYSDADFRAIAEIVYAEAGIVLPKGKAMLVYSRLAPLVRDTGSIDFANYVASMRRDPAVRRIAVDALTTNHTFFFREVQHFEHFAAEVRSELIAALEARERVRLWSAGCSSGEETWSLTLTLLGEDANQGKSLAQRDLRILASDLSFNILERASQGRYGEADVKEVPKALRTNWLESKSDTVSIGPVARSVVRFRELNLLGDWPMREPFDVIFCRNVMIYFDQPTKERLVLRFARQLRPGGHLYIGHSERVSGPASELLDMVRPTIYRRRAA